MVSEKEIEAALAGYNSLGKYASDRAGMKAALEAAARVRAEANVVGVSLSDLNEWRSEWIEANDPGDDTDCVTPFDKYLYTHPAPTVAALADALRGLLKAYENAFDWTAELPPETAEAERIANEVLYALTAGRK